MQFMGCHFAAGLHARRQGESRELPSYFVKRGNCNARQWLAGWDHGSRMAAAWDEPEGASTARGWFWPNGTTERNRTSCAGHYLDFGPALYRADDRNDTEPGSIHCVVIHPKTEQVVLARYVQTIEQAKSWIEDQACKLGHSL